MIPTPSWVKGPGDFLHWFLTSFARMGADTKWKYGTIRCYVTFGWYQVHSVTHPGYHYGQYPKWLWNLDCRYGHRLLAPLFPLSSAFHKFMYRLAYKMALRRWPEHRQALLDGMDYPELIKGELTDEEAKHLIHGFSRP